ncbi:rhomboid family intramembrane serine protease [Candidatus Poribacteria bacterium]
MLIPIKTNEPTRSLPIITILLIAANMIVFAYQIAAGTQYTAVKYGAIAYELTHMVDEKPLFPYSHYLSLLTYMFLHGGFVHIIGNMLFLNTFGPNLEDFMGHFKFLIFYILCGVVSAIVYILPNFNSPIPLVGASGAIAGVMGAHIRALPGTRIVCLLFFLIRITLPAVAILFPWILLQFYNVGMGGQSNVAWIAHIGGFFLGVFLVRKFQSKRNIRSLYHY